MWTEFLRSFGGDPSRADRAVSLLSRLIAAAALLLIAATWPLWTWQAVFPRVPFLVGLDGIAPWLEGTALATALGALATVLIAGSQRRAGRWSLLVFVAAVALLVLVDQHRLQPWIYQISLLALILAVLPAPEAIGWARLLVVSIYFYSALSKLDWTFIASGGGPIVDGLFRLLPLHRDEAALTQRLLAGSLAVGELIMAVGLCWRRWRHTAFAASLVMHVLLLAALGPWGAGHKPGVLVWNLFFVAQNVVLFAGAGEERKPADLAFDRPPTIPLRLTAGRPFRAAVRGAVAFALLFPLSESFGGCDVWPAWAVYATGPERLHLYISQADVGRLPAVVQPYVDAPRFLDGRSLVRIDRWSLEATRAPLYPQNRFRLGVALALAQVAGLEKTVHVEMEGAADRWTGRRSSKSLTGAAPIAGELERCWLNGFPRPFAVP